MNCKYLETLNVCVGFRKRSYAYMFPKELRLADY